MTIIITTILCNNQKYEVYIPQQHYWSNGQKIKFIICFKNLKDKRCFIKNCKAEKELTIDFEIYHNCKVMNILFSHKARCYSTDKKLNEEDVLDYFLNG